MLCCVGRFHNFSIKMCSGWNFFLFVCCAEMDPRPSWILVIFILCAKFPILGTWPSIHLGTTKKFQTDLVWYFSTYGFCKNWNYQVGLLIFFFMVYKKILCSSTLEAKPFLLEHMRQWRFPSVAQFIEHKTTKKKSLTKFFAHNSNPTKSPKRETKTIGEL